MFNKVLEFLKSNKESADKANKVQLRKLCMHVTPSGKRSEALYQKFAKASKEELQDELRKAWDL